MHKILFYNKFYFMPSTCFKHHFDLLMMSTWCSKHVEARNKTYCKTKFCASSWLITKIKKTFTVTVQCEPVS